MRLDNKKRNLQLKNENLHAKDLDSALKYSKRSININSREIEAVQKTIEKMGLVHLKATFEADHLMAKLSNMKKAEAVMSDDGDLLVYGISKLVKAAAKKIDNKNFYEVVDLNLILESLRWDLDQLIDFAILSGTDYNSNPKGMGPVTSYQLINEYKSVEKILMDDKWSKKFVMDNIWNYEVIR
jgi:5'-3' exonuclease